MSRRTIAFVLLLGCAPALGAQITRPDPDRRRPGAQTRQRAIGGTTDISSWTVWWELNKDRYLGPPRRAEQSSTPGIPDLFVGRKVRTVPHPFVETDPGRRVVKALCRLLGDRDDAVRAAATYAVGLVGRNAPETCVDGLARRLSDSSAVVRHNAILAIGLLGKPEAAKGLAEIHAGTAKGAKLLGRDNVTDRERALAALALGLLRAPDAVDRLVRAGKDDRVNLEVRAASVSALGLIDDPRIAPVLIDLVERRRTPVQIRAMALTSLGRLAVESGLETIALALEDRYAEVRRAAVLAAGLALPQLEARRRDNPLIARAAELAERVRRQLAELAVEDIASVRALAAVTLGQVGGSENVELVADLIHDSNRQVGHLAALGVGLLGRRGRDADRFGELSLLHAFRRASDNQRIAATAIGLGLYGKQSAGPEILKRLRPEIEPRLQAHLSLALGMLGHAGASPRVVEALLTVRGADAVEDTVLGSARVGLSPEALATLRDRATDGNDRREQAHAASALAFSGTPDHLKTVGEFIASTRVPARYRAFVVVALGRAADERAFHPLARLTAGLDYHIAIGAIDRAMGLKW